MSPRVLSVPKVQQQSFEEWFRLCAPFFADHPLFKVYKHLHALGVDLNFLDFLRDVLSRMNSLADNWSRPALLSSAVEARGLGKKVLRHNGESKSWMS